MRLAAMDDGGVWDEELDAKNNARLREIIQEIGWPTASIVGREAAHAAWLILQHNPGDTTFMRQCLELMRHAPEGEVAPPDIAYLEDRILIQEQAPQIYGTQFQLIDGDLKPFPIADPEHVDNRRASVGLGTLAEYTQRMHALHQKIATPSE